MLNNDHFYNRTIRKVIVAFGTVFNDLEIIRYNKAQTKEYERIRIPLSYGPKEKYLTRITTDPHLTKSIATVVPRIAFDLTSLSYDVNRKLNTMSRNAAVQTNGSIAGQYNPVPYDFDFDMAIYVRNIEDGTQILEQILPFFTPDFTVTVNLNEAMGRKYDMPIVLNSVSSEIDYESDMTTTRLVIWNLSFTAKGYIFPAVKTNSSLIYEANTNFYIDSRNAQSQQVYVDTANSSGVFTTNETYREITTGKSGTIVYYSNNTTGLLVVTNVSDLLNEGDEIVGDYSHARAIIDTVDVNPLKTVSVVITTNPYGELPNNDFGYTTTIEEFPNTI